MPTVELSEVSITTGTSGAKRELSRKEQAAVCCGGGLVTGLAIFCIAVGTIVLVLPATLTEVDIWSVPANFTANSNYSCAAILPSGSPYATEPETADQQEFLTAWNAYVTTTLGREEGVRSGCEPLRFPATSTYRGVVLIWHGFSSCPQEMAVLGPPLAAMGYDVLIPLMPGHGNALRYQPDAPNYLWGWLTLGFSLLGLAVMGCARICPFAQPCSTDKGGCCDNTTGCCGHKSRTRCIYGTCILLVVLMIVSVVAILIAVTPSDAVFCLSLSFDDGVGPGCDGFAEYNDNLPADAAGYTVPIEAMSEIVRLAPGEKVLAGLSGGGGAALHAGMTALNADGTALFSRQLLVAPYLDVAVIGPMLDTFESIGLGDIKVDFGASCRGRRGLGKRGYCNYKFNRIRAMRAVAQNAYANLVMPPGASVEVVMSQGDGTVTNDDIALLADRFDDLAAASPDRVSSRCMADHVDNRHSPLSIWNYIHQIEDDQMPWVPELACQFARFLANGTALPINGTVEGHDKCATACATPGACSYDCHAMAYLTCGA